MTMEVRRLQPGSFDAWDDYVNRHEQGTFYHLSGWQEVIDSTYAHPCYFSYVVEDDKITAVLPLVQVKSKLFGNTLISTPFCIQGGILADHSSAYQMLVEHAKSLAKQLEVSYVEFRSEADKSLALGLVCPKEQLSVVFGCELASQPAKILANVKKKQRAVIRQSLNNNLRYQIEDDVTNLYKIYSYSVRNLGTPVFSKRLFQRLLAVFPTQCEILTVFHEEKPVSSVMSFYYKGKVLPHFGGGVHDARALKSNDYMYYQLMCHGAQKGCDYFDFGRSKVDSGAYNYKKHWGMQASPAGNHYYLNLAKDTPTLNVNNPKYALAIKLWKKLPLPVSQLLGPQLSKYLG